MNSPKTPRASTHKKLHRGDSSPRTPAINTRKSILKTPGTRSRNKSLIFNEVINFKSPEKRMSTRRSSTASNKDAGNANSFSFGIFKHTQKLLYRHSTFVATDKEHNYIRGLNNDLFKTDLSFFLSYGTMF